ncbi:predicted protein [Uncinocarpus reesii 1704]|uniref:Myb-like DNA-binding domain-containing protein n=1 Tax=Uncinocarpus reesii (strain UAMH 1704) TaxID=336963 RepID=C4JMR7_UNCRE|nr:uncharacterized protein UREG_04125 [Uncinocarpus reesii 1704]EEP79279.1 predicted protein [Uncinocarpus reesii 1704]
MSRISADDQLNFLLSCVKNSNNGKVNFAAVAEECEIVTKGAAAKRYERLMKANGINPNGGGPATPADGEPSPPETPKKPRKAPASKAGTPKEPKSAASTPRKRKGGKAAGAAADNSPTKKYKSAGKIKAEDSDDGAAANNDAASGETQTGNAGPENDPFLVTAVGSDKNVDIKAENVEEDIELEV